ncbi:MAG: TolC family protein [Desulfobacterales bacterium]|nr:TolC family protein [Desulfobacterales bacterium]
MLRALLTDVRILMLSVALIFAGPVAVFAGSAYRLIDFYRMALDRAERIQISREDLAIAEQTREKAMAVLKPRFSAVTAYRDYTEDEVLSGTVVQPDWEGSYGIKVGQSFTLNGRELTALRIAETDIERYRHELDAVREGYLLEVATAFYNVARAGKTLEIADANLQRLQTHRDAVDRKLRLAEVTKTELFRTDAELAKADADRIQAENTLRLARAALTRLAGVETEFEIIGETGDPTGSPISDLHRIRTTALENRAEIKGLKLLERAAEDRITYSKGAYWPTVGLEGGWQRYNRSPDPLLDESVYLGVSLDFQFYDGGLRKAEVYEARLRRRQASYALSEAARSIAFEVEIAWSDVGTQRGVIVSLESQRLYAGENYEAVQQLFDHGMANSVDIMDANTLLVTAERELADARYRLRTALLKLDRAAGTFLAHVEESLARTAADNPDLKASATR